MEMRLILIFFLIFSVSGAAQDSSASSLKLRVAKIDMQTVFASYSKTLQAAQEVANERAFISKQSQLVGDEITKLQETRSEMQLALESRTLPSEEREQIQREDPILQHDISRLIQKQKSEWEQANARLNQQMMQRMERILASLRESAVTFAKVQDFHLLFDSSGTNTSQVVPILFAKGVVDLTEAFAKSLAEE